MVRSRQTLHTYIYSMVRSRQTFPIYTARCLLRASRQSRLWVLTWSSCPGTTTAWSSNGVPSRFRCWRHAARASSRAGALIICSINGTLDDQIEASDPFPYTLQYAYYAKDRASESSWNTVPASRQRTQSLGLPRRGGRRARQCCDTVPSALRTHT